MSNLSPLINEFFHKSFIISIFPIFLVIFVGDGVKCYFKTSIVKFIHSLIISVLMAHVESSSNGAVVAVSTIVEETAVGHHIDWGNSIIER